MSNSLSKSARQLPKQKVQAGVLRASQRQRQDAWTSLSPSLSLGLTDPSQPQQTAEPAMRDADKCLVGGSLGASLPSYFPTPISITYAVWTTGASQLMEAALGEGQCG